MNRGFGVGDETSAQPKRLGASKILSLGHDSTSVFTQLDS